MQPIFVTGIGTGVGKTLAAAILAEALEADYWKPIQAGYEEGTDSEWVKSMVSPNTLVHAETYRLKLPASPHIAAREEGLQIDLEKIVEQFRSTDKHKRLVIEGAGGLLVPLNERDKITDLIKKLDALVILVSRNYLGSINHSLLTAGVCRAEGLRVAGWLFNDQYMDYEEEIVDWSGYPRIASIPFAAVADKAFVKEQAALLKDRLNYLYE